jgi:hypothetical protein
MLHSDHEDGHVSISATLLATGSGSVPIWSLGAAVSVFAAGVTVASAVAVCVFPDVDSLDAPLRPVGIWDLGCCFLHCCSCLTQVHSV